MYEPEEEEIFFKTDFLDKLRKNPQSISDEEIENTLIKGFINKWKCRVKNNTESARAIKECIDKLKPQLQNLNGIHIETETIDLNKLKPIIIEIYDEIRGSLKDYRFGPTAISKLLHIINPDLFVMWDGKIRDDYTKNKNSKIRDSGEGYFTFLEEMRKIAKEIIDDFRKSKSSLGADVASYLNDKLKVRYKQSLAKYMDEYNWLIITRRKGKPILPIDWHPIMDD